MEALMWGQCISAERPFLSGVQPGLQSLFRYQSCFYWCKCRWSGNWSEIFRVLRVGFNVLTRRLGWAFQDAGFRRLNMIWLFYITCKLNGISPAFSGTQPSLRSYKFQWSTLNRNNISIYPGIPTASPFRKGGLRGIFPIQPRLIKNLRTAQVAFFWFDRTGG